MVEKCPQSAADLMECARKRELTAMRLNPNASLFEKENFERRPTAMKKYSNPKLEIVELTTVDVLTLSGESIIPPIVADPNESPSIPLG